MSIPDLIKSLEKPYSMITKIEIDPEYVIVTEVIDLRHPECPIVKVGEVEGKSN